MPSWASLEQLVAVTVPLGVGRVSSDMERLAYREVKESEKPHRSSLR
jgi:hypothetical protein